MFLPGRYLALTPNKQAKNQLTIDLESHKDGDKKPKGREAIPNLPSPRRVVQGSPLLDVVVNIAVADSTVLGSKGIFICPSW